MTIVLRPALAGATALVLAACFSDRPDDGTGPPTDGDVIIEMTTSLRFTPENPTIQAGQTIVWRNTSTFVHTSTADASKANDPSNVQLPEGASTWDSGTVTGGQEFALTFNTPGEYRYFCIPHELANMVGAITVE